MVTTRRDEPRPPGPAAPSRRQTRTRVALLVLTAGSLGLALLVSPATPPDAAAPAVLVSVIALGVLAALEARRPCLPDGAATGAGVALAIAAVTRAPHGSGDLWSYAMYGRILAVHHANPYVHRPSAFGADPLLRRVTPGWRNSRSVYGPLFTAASAAIMAVAGRSVLATRLAFQGLAAAAGVTSLIVVRRLQPPSWMYVVLACNPLLVLWTYNGGHNDALVGLAVVAAAIAALRDRPLLAGLAMAAALQVKIIAALAAAALAVWTLRRHGWRAAAAQLTIEFAPLAAGYLAFGGVSAMRPLFGLAGQLSRATVWELAKPVVPNIAVHHTGIAVFLLTAVTAGALLMRGRREATPMLAIAGVLIAYLVAGAYVLPWYVAWVLPLLCLVPSRPLQILGVVESLALSCAYEYRHEARLDSLDRVLRLSVTGAQVVALVACVAIIGSVFVHRTRAASTP